MLVKNSKRFFHHLSNKVSQYRKPAGKIPYPISISKRDIAVESSQSRSGLEIFEEKRATDINQARMMHLLSLQIPLKGRSVLDVGCGVGHLGQFLSEQGSNVVGVDGREENIVSLRSRYPNLTAHVLDIDIEPLSQLGMFDIVFCYGLLYHLENPLAALRNITASCRNILLLETLICDHNLPVLHLIDEPLTPNQALRGLGCRPSPSYVAMALNRVGFPFVYAPKIPPEHRDFRFEWKNDLEAWRDGHPLRCIFVASHTELQNSHLVNLFTN